MKHGKVIKIRGSQLIGLRNNFRAIIRTAIYAQKKILRERIEEMFYNSNGSKKELESSDWNQSIELRKKHDKLETFLKNSICKCGCCNATNIDMVYHAGWEQWWCLECFEHEKRLTDLDPFFNKGVIVHKYATKPCWVLDWCPYGSLIEDFRIRNIASRYTCEIFGHDCPVFYVSENITEDSDIYLINNTKLKDNLMRCKSFNDKKIVAFNIEKPCRHPYLNFCPYGSLGEEFHKREENYKYGCNVFPHDCPIFYHARQIREHTFF